MEEKILEISVKLNIIESLARILLECLNEGDNLKIHDKNNLSRVILDRVFEVKNIINEVEIKMNL